MQAMAEGSFINPTLGDDKPTSTEAGQLEHDKLQRKTAEKETGHANTAHASYRALLVLVITMCLISLAVLLLTLLMLFGKIGNGCGCSTDEASSSSGKSLATDSSQIKVFEENITKGLMEHLMQFNDTLTKTEAGYNALRDDLDITRNELLLITDNITLTSRLEYLGAELTGLKSVLNRTNTDLSEIKNTQKKEKIIYHQMMTPSWLEAHASYINSYRSSTSEQITFNASSVYNANLLQVPLIPANVLQNSTMLTVKIVFSNDVSIGKNEDSDIRLGLSDGLNLVGFLMNDKGNYNARPPCFGFEGLSGASLTITRRISRFSARPNETFYPSQFDITVKLDARESWGSCYTAHDGGFVTTFGYDKRLVHKRGLTLEVYKEQKYERVGIKFIEVTVVDDL